MHARPSSRLAWIAYKMRWTPWPTSPSEKEAPHASRGRAWQAQAPPSIFCDPILRQTRSERGNRWGRRRGVRSPIPPRRDRFCVHLREEESRRGRLAGGREAGGKLGEDANGELSPEPTRREDLHDCLRAWSLVCFDFKARASGAVDAQGIKAKQDELVASILAFRSENKHGIM